MSIKSAHLFLVHCETGQRYAVKGDVVIGRNSGDIVFSTDTKLSQEHCRLIPKPEGLTVCDLASANGTFIDGKKLTAGRLYIFKPEGKLSVGNQAFTLKSISVETVARRKAKTSASRKRSRRRRRTKSDAISTMLFLAFSAIVLGAMGWIYLHPTGNSAASLPSAQHELNAIFENYAGLESSVDRGTAPAKTVIAHIQTQVLIRLNGLSARVSEIPPANEHERQLLSLEQNFINALAKHARAKSAFLASGDLKSQEELDALETQMEQIAAEFNQSLDPQQLATSALPTPIQSPQQIVEKDMRRAMFAYRQLGRSVHEQSVTEKQMATTIRNELIPQLTAVSTKLGAIKPENEGETQRLTLEQKLVLAFLGQVKAMAAYTDSGNEKYAKELETWGAQIEKLNAELKTQAQRQPAGTP